MRRPARLSFVVALALAGVGCGGEPASSPTASAPAFGPHGGPIVEFPGAKAYVEIIGEPAPPSGKSGQAVIAAYFYQNDLKQPLEAKPTDVEVQIRTPDSPEPVKLKLVPQPGKLPRDKNRLASPPGPYMMDQYAGELTANLGGVAEVKTFNGGR